MNYQTEIFPKLITKNLQADIPIDGLKAYLLQTEDQQVVLMEFEKDAVVAEHSHETQWGVVLEGRIDLTIDDVLYTYQKGDRFFIPKDVKHSAFIHAGYTSIEFFDQKDRYRVVESS